MVPAPKTCLLPLLALAACSSDPRPAPAAPVDGGAAAETAAPATPAPGAPPPELPPEDLTGESARVDYACADGSSPGVRYGHYDATITFDNGSITTLPRAESASSATEIVYVGTGLSMQRRRGELQIFRGGRALYCTLVPGRG